MTNKAPGEVGAPATHRASLWADTGRLALFQLLAAVGQLGGVRLLTGAIPPGGFGEIALWQGVVALASTALANPTMQALLRIYPEYEREGQGATARAVAHRQIVTLVLWLTVPVFAAALLAWRAGWVNPLTVALVAALIAVEIARLQGVTVLNATRQHFHYGLWSVLESWGRPLLAWLLVWRFGDSTRCVLAGFLMASTLTWLVMRRYVSSREALAMSPEMSGEIAKRFLTYALPLLPLGLIGWISGMSDRYLIGALLSPSDAGLYVAVYGLGSRPMLSFGSLIESSVRPAYLGSLARGDYGKADTHLRHWACVVTAGSAVALLVSVWGHRWLARILLGESFRVESSLLPWIVFGYYLYILSHVFVRACYAHGATGSVLLVEALGAVVAVVAGAAGIMLAGLQGAAMAVPVYFGAQLAMAYAASRRVPRMPLKPCPRTIPSADRPSSTQ